MTPPPKFVQLHSDDEAMAAIALSDIQHQGTPNTIDDSSVTRNTFAEQRQERLAHFVPSIFRAVEPFLYVGFVALLLYWQNDDTRSWCDVELFARFLNEELGFQVTIWAIPGNTKTPEDCERLLRLKVAKFIERHSDPRLLLLLFYSGHGYCSTRTSPHTHCIFPHVDVDASWLIPFDTIVFDDFFAAENDTLVVLDCCAAGGVFRGLEWGRRDIFAACAKESMTIRGPANQNEESLTFTRFLVQAGLTLVDEGKQFTVQEWDKETQRCEGLKRTPRVTSYPTADRHEIWLSPQQTDTRRARETIAAWKIDPALASKDGAPKKAAKPAGRL